MGTNTAIEGPTSGPGSAVLAGVVTAPPVTPRVGGPYSLQDAPVDPSPGSYHTEEDDNEDNSSREERLLPERPRRSSFDVAMHEDPLFNTRHPCARKLRMAFKKAWGLVLMIIASALLSTATLVVSLLSTKFSTWELSAWRLFGQWICTLIYVRIYKTSLRFEQKAMGAMVLRCFAGLGSMLFLYMAIRHMAMANATIIRYTSPVMVCVLAKIVWGEPFTWVHGVACFFSFCGAVFVAQPSFIFGEREVSSSSNAKGGGGGTKLQHHIAWGFSFAAAVFAALAFLSIRALKKVHPMVTTHWFSCLGFFAVGVVAFFTGITTPPHAKGWIMLASIGVLGFFGQWAMCRSLQIERAGPATMMRYMDVAFAFLFQVTIENQSTNAWALLGAAMVIMCAGLIGFQRCFKRREAIVPPSRPRGLSRASQASRLSGLAGNQA